MMFSSLCFKNSLGTKVFHSGSLFQGMLSFQAELIFSVSCYPFLQPFFLTSRTNNPERFYIKETDQFNLFNIISSVTDIFNRMFPIVSQVGQSYFLRFLVSMNKIRLQIKNTILLST